MPIAENKISFLPSQGVIGGYTTSTSISLLEGPVYSIIPSINDTITISTGEEAFNQAYTLEQNENFVYKATKFSFSYVEKTRNLNFAAGQASMFRTFLKIPIFVEEDRIPSITGIKVIGSFTTTAQHKEQMNVWPYGNPADIKLGKGVTMFKLWRGLKWNFENSEPPYKPTIALNQGQVEYYASTMGSYATPNSFLSTTNTNSSYQNQFKVAGSEGVTSVGVEMAGLNVAIGCNSYESPSFDSSTINNDGTLAQYDLDLGAQFNTGYMVDDDLTVIRGLVTTY